MGNKNKTLPTTLQEALDMGWKLADVKYQLGYVSRRVNVSEQHVYRAGGYRKGDFYVLLPNWSSTVYCFRQYLRKPEE